MSEPSETAKKLEERFWRKPLPSYPLRTCIICAGEEDEGHRPNCWVAPAIQAAQQFGRCPSSSSPAQMMHVRSG